MHVNMSASMNEGRWCVNVDVGSDMSTNILSYKLWLKLRLLFIIQVSIVLYIQIIESITLLTSNTIFYRNNL